MIEYNAAPDVIVVPSRSFRTQTQTGCSVCGHKQLPSGEKESLEFEFELETCFSVALWFFQANKCVCVCGCVVVR